MHSKIKKQSIYDHSSVLISIQTSGSISEKILSNAIFDYFRTFHNSYWIKENENNLLIRFNFKHEKSLYGQEWKNFQLHRRPFLYIFIDDFTSGCDLESKLKFYSNYKSKYTDTKLILLYDEASTDLVNTIETVLSQDDISSDDSLQNEFVDPGDILEVETIRKANCSSDIKWLAISTVETLNSRNSSTLSSSSENTSLWSNMSSSGADLDLSNNNFMSAGSSNLLSQGNLRSIFLSIIDKLQTIKTDHEKSIRYKLELKSTETANSDTASVVSLEDTLSSETGLELVDPIESSERRQQSVSAKIFKRSTPIKLRGWIGRKFKQLADLSMLLNKLEEAFFYYQQSICYLRRVDDYLWLNGAEEGLCCCWILYQLSSDKKVPSQAALNKLQMELKEVKYRFFTLPENSILTSNNNQDQVDFTFLRKITNNTASPIGDVAKNPPTITNMEQLIQLYNQIIAGYKKLYKTLTNTAKDRIHPIHFDSSVKASQFFIQQKMYLQATEFLKLIKTDLLTIDADLNRYHRTMAQLYAQMGFQRKVALHMYQQYRTTTNIYNQSCSTLQQNRNRVGSHHKSRTGSIYSNNSSSSISNRTSVCSTVIFPSSPMEQLLDILRQLDIDCSGFVSANTNSSNHRRIVATLSSQAECSYEETIALVNFTNNKSKCYPMQVWIIQEILRITANLDRSSLLSLTISLCEYWGQYLSSTELAQLLKCINSSNIPGSSSYSSIRRCFVGKLPEFIGVELLELSHHLRPKYSNISPSNSTSVFLYTPLDTTGNAGTFNKSVVWVSEEECEVLITLNNLLAVPLQITDINFLINCLDTGENHWLQTEGSSIHHLSPNVKRVSCNVVIIPPNSIAPGKYRLIDIRYSIIQLCSREIKFYPPRQHSIFKNTPLINLFQNVPILRLCSSIPESKPLIAQQPDNTILVNNLQLYCGEKSTVQLFLSNECRKLDVNRIELVLDELELQSSGSLVSRVLDEMHNNTNVRGHRLVSVKPTNPRVPLLCLNHLSLATAADDSSLIASISEDNSNASLPTETSIKMIFNASDETFLREAFIGCNDRQFERLWLGQIRLQVKYSSDPDMLMYRQCCFVVNCQISASLVVMGYRLDQQLNLWVDLINYASDKMKIDVLWNTVKLSLQISAAPMNSLDCVTTNIGASCDLVSASVDGSLIQLKSQFDTGTLKGLEDLTNYIASNLKILWTTKDADTNKTRHGKVDINHCLCRYHPHYNFNFDSQVTYGNDDDNDDINENNVHHHRSLQICHSLQFSEYDLIRIWMVDNATLEIETILEESSEMFPPDNSIPFAPLFTAVQFTVTISFQQATLPNYIDLNYFKSLYLVPSIDFNVPNALASSSNDVDNDSNSNDIIKSHNRRCYTLAGVTKAHLNYQEIANTKKFTIECYVIFLQPGMFKIQGKILADRINPIHWYEIENPISTIFETDQSRILILHVS